MPNFSGATAEKLKAEMSAKIDSYDAYIAALKRANIDPHYYTGNRTPVYLYPSAPFLTNAGTDGLHYAGSPGQIPIEQRWWVEREQLRREYGVYPEGTEIMEAAIKAFQLAQYFPHVSKDDPKMIAYTASPEDGMRDKQVRTTLAKFLRKHCLLLTDAHIQTIDQLHRSAMDPTFLRATTYDEIVRVYTTMEGDSGCMRYTEERWLREEKIELHPASVYEYPGLAVAYTQLDDGTVRSRAVIYDNPNDPKDKRYVRLYGDPILKRKLEANGYVCGSLDGVKIKRVARKDTGQCIVPYIDGAGGSRDDQNVAAHAITFEGADYLLLMTAAKAARIYKRTGVRPAELRGTSGKATIPELEEQDFLATCAISGKEFNMLEVDSERLWHNGKLSRVLTEALTEPTSAAYYFQPNTGGWGKALVFTEELGTVTFYSGGVRIDRELERNALGFVQLCAAFGYDQAWRSKGGTWAIPYEGKTVYILKEDLRYVATDDGTRVRSVHVSEYDALRKAKTHVPCAMHAGVRTLMPKDCPGAVTTRSGKKVLPAVHDVVQCVDGQWAYERNVTAVTLFNRNYYFPVGTKQYRLTDERLMKDYMDSFAITAKDVIDLEQLEAWAEGRRRAYLSVHRGTLFYYLDQHDNLRQGTSGLQRGDISVAQVRGAIAKIDAMTDEQIADVFYPDAVPHARDYAYNCGRFLAQFDAIVAEYTARLGGQTRIEDVLAQADAALTE